MSNINDLIQIINYINSHIEIVPKQYVNSNNNLKLKIIELIQLKLSDENYLNSLDQEILTLKNIKKELK